MNVNVLTIPFAITMLSCYLFSTSSFTTDVYPEIYDDNKNGDIHLLFAILRGWAIAKKFEIMDKRG
jgi:hypothetical protein